MNYQKNASLHAQFGSAGASGGSPLLAQVGLIVAPEKKLLQEFFLTVDKDIRSRGCHLAVSTDFHEFKELSLALGKTFFPAFDPDLHDLNPDHVFWLALRQSDENGPLIAIQAGKLQLLGDRTLGDYIATGRFFYADPLSQMESGERFLLTGDADAFASQVFDRIVYSGGTTIVPEWRGKTNLARVLPLLSHTLGYSRWYADRVISMIEDELRRSVVAKRYAHLTECDGFEWYRPRKPQRSKFWIVSKRAPEIVDQAKAYLGEPAADRLVIGKRASAGGRTGFAGVQAVAVHG